MAVQRMTAVQCGTILQAYSYVGGRLSAALSSSGGSGVGSWQEVELAVSLLYQLGEGAPDEAMKAGEEGAGEGFTRTHAHVKLGV